MSINVRSIQPGTRGVRDFLAVGPRVYRTDPMWVQPLDLDMTMRLDPKQNPFFQHAEAALFVAERDGELVGRVSVQVDQEHLKTHEDNAAFFGFIDTIDDQAVVSALMQAAEGWARAKGMRVLRGPFSLSINEECGLLVEGFDTPPKVLMAHHRDYQGALVEGAGYAKCKDLYAWYYNVGEPPPRVRRAHAEIAAMPNVTVREFDTSQMPREIAQTLDIFNDAWKDNWGFVPLTPAEAAKMAEDMKLLLVPSLALLVEIDGEPAAVSIALPDVNECIGDLGGKLFPAGVPSNLLKMLWRLKVEGTRSARLIILGIRKKFRSQRQYAGLSLYLYAEMNDRGKKLGMTHGELSWTLEDNGPVNTGIKVVGGKVYKRYRIYEKTL